MKNNFLFLLLTIILFAFVDKVSAQTNVTFSFTSTANNVVQTISTGEVKHCETINLKVTQTDPNFEFAGWGYFKGTVGTLQTSDFATGLQHRFINISNQNTDANANVVVADGTLHLRPYFIDKSNNNNKVLHTAGVTLTIYALPSVGLLYGGSPNTCVGIKKDVSSIISSSNPGNITYQWKFKKWDSNTYVNHANTMPNISIPGDEPNSGYYKLEITDGAGCKNISQELSVKAFPNPTDPLLKLGNAFVEICEGQTFKNEEFGTTFQQYLNNAPKPVSVATFLFFKTYVWSKNGIPIFTQTYVPSNSRPSLSVTQSDTYSLKIMDPNSICTSKEVPFEIRFPTSPKITFNNLDKICGDSEVDINLISDINLDEVVWSVNGVQYGNADTNIGKSYSTKYLPKDIGNYTITVRVKATQNSVQCPHNITNELLIRALDETTSFTVTKADSGLSYCENTGASVELELTNVTGALEYIWYKDGGFYSKSTTNRKNVIDDKASSTGSYRGYIKVSNNCTLTALPHTITVHTTPNLAIISSPRDYILNTPSSSVDLIFSPPTGATGNYKFYVFNNKNANSIATVTAASSLYNVTQAGVFYVKFEDANGCISDFSDGKTIKEIGKPTQIEIVPSDNNVPYGRQIFLKAIYFPLVNVSPVTFTWYRDGVEVASNINSDTLYIRETGTYNVTLKIENQSISTGLGLKINITTPPPTPLRAGIVTFCNNVKARLEMLETTGVYKWFKDNKEINGATSRIYMATEEGTYHATRKLDDALESVPSIGIKVIPENIIADLKIGFGQIGITNVSGANRLEYGKSVNLIASFDSRNILTQFLTFEWTDSKSNNKINTQGIRVQPFVDTTYFLKVTHDIGCEFTAEVIIDVFKTKTHEILERTFNLPLIFTPNNDRNNDTFRMLKEIEYLNINYTLDELLLDESLYPQSIFNIYDANGTHLITFPSYTDIKLWNFTVSGEKLPSGSYYFILDLGTDKERVAGMFSLVRREDN